MQIYCKPKLANVQHFLQIIMCIIPWLSISSDNVFFRHIFIFQACLVLYRMSWGEIYPSSHQMNDGVHHWQTVSSLRGQNSDLSEKSMHTQTDRLNPLVNHSLMVFFHPAWYSPTHHSCTVFYFPLQTLFSRHGWDQLCITTAFLKLGWPWSTQPYFACSCAYYIHFASAFIYLKVS